MQQYKHAYVDDKAHAPYQVAKSTRSSDAMIAPIIKQKQIEWISKRMENAEISDDSLTSCATCGEQIPFNKLEEHLDKCTG